MLSALKNVNCAWFPDPRLFILWLNIRKSILYLFGAAQCLGPSATMECWNVGTDKTPIMPRFQEKKEKWTEWPDGIFGAKSHQSTG